MGTMPKIVQVTKVPKQPRQMLLGSTRSRYHSCPRETRRKHGFGHQVKLMHQNPVKTFNYSSHTKSLPALHQSNNHSLELSFSCTLCDYAGKTATHLKCHRRSHRQFTQQWKFSAVEHAHSSSKELQSPALPTHPWMAYFLSSNLYANVKLFLCFVVVIKTVKNGSTCFSFFFPFWYQ